ncbi:hypothetical protein FNV43_RR01641 [Rhamnella rubrinervis]|uniref:Uncharacterized protein n=1 Tax=Rhamnella rubrinervis TaxID=2594499 RepID=A0A8K0HRB9_9ROSA|nr:hypothetical protein FNV43_RR01641 [Rhamnella rubrinervis]
MPVAPLAMIQMLNACHVLQRHACRITRSRDFSMEKRHRQLPGVQSHIVWVVEERFNRIEGSLILIEAFSERLAKGFVGTPKLSVLRKLRTISVEKDQESPVEARLTGTKVGVTWYRACTKWNVADEDAGPLRGWIWTYLLGAEASGYRVHPTSLGGGGKV